MFISHLKCFGTTILPSFFYQKKVAPLPSGSHKDGHPCAIKSVDLEKTDPEVQLTGWFIDVYVSSL